MTCTRCHKRDAVPSYELCRACRYYMRSHDVVQHGTASIDCLSVTCWCEAFVMSVPRDLVLAGRTLTCGERRCHPEAVTA